MGETLSMWSHETNYNPCETGAVPNWIQENHMGNYTTTLQMPQLLLPSGGHSCHFNATEKVEEIILLVCFLKKGLH